MALKAGEGRYGITRKMFLKLKNLSGGSWNYSTNEVNTGQKWIDGKSIYCKVIDKQSVTVPGGVNFGTIDLSSLNIDTPVFCFVSSGNEILFPWVTDSAASTIGIKYSNTVLGFRKSATGGSATVNNIRAILWYTKVTT